MRRKHQGLARTQDRHGFQSVAALAQVHLSPQKFQHTTGRQQHLSRLVCSCVRMFVTSVCAYLRVGGEQLGVCIIAFDVCVEREWVFCMVGDDGGFLVLLLASVWFQLPTKSCVFSRQVQQKRAGTTG